MHDEVELYVTFRDGRELLYMTPLGNNQYRLEVTSIGGHLRYGDTIEVGTPQSDGAFPIDESSGARVSERNVLCFPRR